MAGEALKCISSLGYSPAAYEAAKARLERKFGGERRRVAIRVEELESFPTVHRGKHKEFERFAEVLDVTIVRLKDSNQTQELGSGTLYARLLKKFDGESLAQYQRWLTDHGEQASVETLAEWVNYEAEVLTAAAETIDGFGRQIPKPSSSHHVAPPRRPPQATFMATTNQVRVTSCAICKGQHKVWTCPDFKRLTVDQRWEKAKVAGLCYRCLAQGHQGQACGTTRVCKTDGCTATHHYLLHGRKPRTQERPAQGVKEGERTTLTSVATDSPGKQQQISLRTVPVHVSNGNRKVQVIALLDDGSTSSYVSSAVAAELGVEGPQQHTRVQLLNGESANFMTMPVQVTLCQQSRQRYLTKGDQITLPWTAEQSIGFKTTTAMALKRLGNLKKRLHRSSETAHLHGLPSSS